ncbi:DUF1826 domain-containing protein [Endozoicomonas arenosclerae]|uniref:DUF1826 domain-containing protein n=1 Tax=Endozoicomonas arenosclerae TaxID=1633495 RepID=UPI000781D17D|nr:DUF1826 domain-containing protein [Endozoicomonas arenosclerae]
MNTMTSTAETLASEIQHRRDVTSNQPGVLADIYREEANITIWQRKLSDSLAKATNHIFKTKPTLQLSTVVTPENAFTIIHSELGSSEETASLSEDITQLVDMFCCLFELKSTGLRLTSLSRAMCPRFHVDHVPCRLVTTYHGVGTQWLPHQIVDRSKLGAGNQGKPDECSGLFDNSDDMQQLTLGDVALLKGERWQGNDGAGLVHRSPKLENGGRRLLLTLDFAND